MLPLLQLKFFLKKPGDSKNDMKKRRLSVELELDKTTTDALSSWP